MGKGNGGQVLKYNKNHSKSFWNKVKTFIPEYNKNKNWLRKNGYLLWL